MSSLKDASKYLSLSDAIRTLKLELIKAENLATEHDDALLEFVECEIELAIEFQPKGEVSVNFGVFQVKGGADAKGVHKVKLKFKSLDQIVASATDTASAKAPKKLPPAKPTRKP